MTEKYNNLPEENSIDSMEGLLGQNHADNRSNIDKDLLPKESSEGKKIKVRNIVEFNAVMHLLRNKQYLGRSIQRFEFAYSIMLNECSRFDMEGVEVFIKIDVDLEKDPQTKTEPTGYSFKGTHYVTGDKEVAVGDSLGKLTLCFLINEKEYPIYDCSINFENNIKDIPWGIEAGSLSDRIKPKIIHTLELLKFLKEENLISFQLK